MIGPVDAIAEEHAQIVALGRSPRVSFKLNVDFLAWVALVMTFTLGGVITTIHYAMAPRITVELCAESSHK